MSVTRSSLVPRSLRTRPNRARTLLMAFIVPTLKIIPTPRIDLLRVKRSEARQTRPPLATCGLLCEVTAAAGWLRFWEVRYRLLHGVPAVEVPAFVGVSADGGKAEKLYLIFTKAAVFGGARLAIVPMFYTRPASSRFRLQT